MAQAFSIKANFDQENYYFDTHDQILKQNNIGLRIRIFKDHAEQTMKVPDLRPVQHNFHEVIEINDNLQLSQAQKLVKQAKEQHIISFKGNVGEYLNKHFAKQKEALQLFTWSKTHRILANGPDNCELTFDMTSYPDGYQDYELEIENTNPAIIKKVQSQLEEKYNFHQTSKNTNQNKIARATLHRK